MTPLAQLRKLLLPALLLSSALAVQAQTNQFDDAAPEEIAAGTPGLSLELDGLFPIQSGKQTPFCFYTGFGSSGTPLSNTLTGDKESSTIAVVKIPADSIQKIPASSFVGGVFKALVYATPNTTDTCNGTFDSSYTDSFVIPIQAPTVLDVDLDSLSASNPNLKTIAPPREIYLQGANFVTAEASVTFSGSGFSTFSGTVAVVSPISARVDVPANLPAGAKSVDLTYCTHTASNDYCAAPVTLPITPLAANPGTLTATPNPTTPTTTTSLQAVFGSTTTGAGVPTGLVTFTDGATNLGTAPLTLTTGQFVAAASTAGLTDFTSSPKPILTDLNRDGANDLILYGSNAVQIFYAADNRGGLGFKDKGAFTGVQFPLDNDFCQTLVSMTTADFNNDGYPDIAMLCTDPANSGATDNVLVYLNQGDGSFAREAAIFPVASAHLIAAADFNNDGFPDILLAGPDGNTDPNGTPVTGFNVYFGDGSGNFGPSTPIDAPLGDGLQITAVDFNNDGFPDVAILYHDFSSDLSTSQIVVFQNDGKGSFPTRPTVQESLGATGATTQFFTRLLPGSKYPDLVAINTVGVNASIAEVFNNQTSTIGFGDTIYSTPVPGLQSAAMGDFNGDGFQDVAVFDGSNLSVYNADTTGQYNQPLDSFTLAAPVIALLGSSDTNSDGYSDPIALVSGNGPQVQQYITSGTATASLPGLTFAAGSHNLTATTPGTYTLSGGTATATLVSNVPALLLVSNALLTTSPTSPTTYGPASTVTLTAEIDSSNAPAPTGTVQFFNSLTNKLLGTVTLTPTSATTTNASLPIGVLTVGDYLFSAVYSGDSTYAGATLPAVDFQITKATPTIAFAPNPAGIVYPTALSGAQLDATATLGGSTVAGAFAYTTAAGKAVTVGSVLTVASYPLTATFTPADTADYVSGATATATVTSTQATPVVAFAPNPASIPFGAALSTAQLDATATVGGSPIDGTFAYLDGQNQVNTGTVLAGGVHNLRAFFSPTDTADYASPNSVSANVTVTQATPGVALSVSPITPTTYSPTGNETLTATLTVTNTVGATGSVQFFDGATSLGTVTLTVGTPGSTTISTASFTTSAPLTGGPHSLTAAYPGDGNYSSVTSAISNYVVNKATPIITFTPTPSTFTYGAALSTQLNATAKVGGNTVPGTFVYTVSSVAVTSSTVLSSGPHTIVATFTPTDTTDYVSGGSASGGVTVFTASPALAFSPTPLSITYGTPLVASQLDATATFQGSPLAGTFSYISGGFTVTTSTVLTAGNHTLAAVFTPTDTTDFISGDTVVASLPITVTPATPTIAFAPNPTSITFGTQLSATQLNATASLNATPVSGTFVYTTGAGIVVNNTTVLSAGPHLITATFTPDDTTDYASGATGSATVTVTQATPTITFAPNPASIPFGTALSTAQLDATATFNGSPVVGTFAYLDGQNPVTTGTVLGAGPHTIRAFFTPTDTNDFASGASAQATVTVTQNVPVISFSPNPASISSNTPLSAAQLDAAATFNGSPVAGIFSYTTGGVTVTSGTLLAVGPHVITATFAPADTTDFTSGGTAQATVTVTQNIPVVTFAPNPATITFGTALSGAQLDATATFNGSAVAGAFIYTNAANAAVAVGTVLPVGGNVLTVAFTPADTSTYITPNPVPATITVSKAAPGVTLSVTPITPTTYSVNANETLGATVTAASTQGATGAVQFFDGATSLGTATLIVGASGPTTPSTASLNTSTPLKAGTHSLTVAYLGDGNFSNTTSATTTYVVNQAAPTITWTPPAAITLGAALSATQLNATATVAGTFTYDPALGAVPAAGANTLGVTFTPTDTVDYKAATASVPLTVNPATTTTTVVSSTNPSQFGQTVTFTVGATSAYTGAAIGGTVSVYDSATLLGTAQLPNLTITTSTLSAGPHNITAVYGGSTNFATSTSAVLSETINSATTTITWAQPANVPYGARLSTTQLNATVATSFAQNVPGAFTYTPAAGTLLTAGSQTLSVLFTPTDTTSFKTATATVTLVVTKIAPSLSWTTPANITAGTPLSATQLNATAVDIAANPLPGVFTYTPAGGAILGPGATTLSATFAPTDTVDYNNATITVPLNVDPAVATIAVTSSANPSQFGQSVNFTVNLTSAYTASPIGGTVTISDGKTVLATPTLANGAATFSTSTLTAGVHNITASFVGNPTFAAATSPVLTQTVNLATTTIAWLTPAGIGYGTLLSATQLNATVATPYATTIPGTFVYTPAAGALLPAGAQTLSVAFTPTDTANFKSATGSVTIAVGKTAPTIAWATPADVVAGTVLSTTQLNATATGIAGTLPGAFVYTPALGTVLTAGTQTLSATFTPTDLANYTTATATVSLNVIGLALTSLSTTAVKLGDPNLNLTLTGTGFLPDSVVKLGTTSLTPTFVNATTLTAVIPGSNFVTAQTLQVTVNDPTQGQTSNALTILVGAPPATITVNGPPTVAPTAQPNLTFTVTPYAVPITATLTLTFTPAPGLTTDGTILFPNGTTTTTFTIPANTATIPAVPFQSGSVAGTITVTLKLTAGGVDVTPTPAPTLVIASPAVVPGVSAVTLDRSGQTLTVTIQGYSNTRDIQQIHFHFVAAPGQSLATSDLVIDGTALFNSWYTNPASPTYGSTFHYIQVFNLDQDATVVGQVQVTLVNSLGNSQTVSAQ